MSGNFPSASFRVLWPDSRLAESWDSWSWLAFSMPFCLHHSHHMTIFEGYPGTKTRPACVVTTFPACPAKVGRWEMMSSEGRIMGYQIPDINARISDAFYECLLDKGSWGWLLVLRIRDIMKNKDLLRYLLLWSFYWKYILQINPEEFHKIWIILSVRMFSSLPVVFSSRLMAVTLIVSLMTGYEGDTVITWSMSGTGPNDGVTW